MEQTLSGPDRKSPDLEKLEQATNIAAGIVRRQGEVYWPIFERLDKELRGRKKRFSRLNDYQ